MESLLQAVTQIKSEDYNCSPDIRHAYLHVPEEGQIRHQMVFKWNQEIRQWVGLPFGLVSAPRIYKGKKLKLTIKEL